MDLSIKAYRDELGASQDRLNMFKSLGGALDEYSKKMSKAYLASDEFTDLIKDSIEVAERFGLMLDKPGKSPAEKLADSVSTGMKMAISIADGLSSNLAKAIINGQEIGEALHSALVAGVSEEVGRELGETLGEELGETLGEELGESVGGVLGALGGALAGKLAGSLFNKIGGFFGFGGESDAEKQRKADARLAREKALEEALEAQRKAHEELIQSLESIGAKFIETGYATEEFKKWIFQAASVVPDLANEFASLYLQLKQAREDLAAFGDLKSGIQQYLPKSPVEQFLESGDIGPELRDLFERQGLGTGNLEEFASARQELAEFEKTVALINKTMEELEAAEREVIAATERLASGITSLANEAIQTGRITGDLDVVLRGLSDDLAGAFRSAIDELNSLRGKRGILEELRGGIQQYLPPSPVEKFLETGEVTAELLSQIADSGITKEDLERFGDAQGLLNRFYEARERGDYDHLTADQIEAMESDFLGRLQSAAVDLNQDLESAIRSLTEAIDRLENKLGSISLEIGSEFAELARLSALLEGGALTDEELEESGYTEADLARFNAYKGQLDPFGEAALSLADIEEKIGAWVLKGEELKAILDAAGFSQEGLNTQIDATRALLEGNVTAAAQVLDAELGRVMGNLETGIEGIETQLSGVVSRIAAAIAAIPTEIHTTHTVTTVYRDSGGPGIGNGNDNGNGDTPPALQHGGPAEAGRPYLVGEAGPEIFVPSRSGHVLATQAIEHVIRNEASQRQPPGQREDTRRKLPDIVVNLDGDEVGRVMAQKMPRVGFFQGWGS